MNAATAIAAPENARWGRDVESATVRGWPCLVYRHRPRSLAELLVDARRWRERTFIVEGERRLSFEQFEAGVARIARQLAQRGIARGDRVMLLAYNCAEWLAAFWALQTLGAVPVLGNAWWSADEAQAALELVRPVAVITDRQDDRALDVPSAQIALASLRPLLQGGEPAPGWSLPAVDEDELALVMFTSGTTGQAKGVMMSHRGVIANIQNLLVLTGRMPSELPADQPGTVSLLTVPLFHLAGVQISFSTLLSGGTLVLLEGSFDAQAVLRLIERERVRVWGSIPTMVSRVLEHPALPRYDTSSLRSIPMGGAAIAPELRDKLRAAFSGVKKSVGSLYGLTEAGGVLAAGSAADLEGRPGCVGRPLPVVEIRVAQPDAHGNGEIMARTPSATLGYWGDPAPIADGQGWVRTGDLGRCEDGYLYLTGRSKDIIIRGGENIACAHVEQCLLAHPDVREAAVIALPHADLGEEVAAVVVLREGARAGVAELRKHAAAHLGKFQVPSRWWLRRDPLPVNATGKIDKRGLPRAWAGD